MGLCIACMQRRWYIMAEVHEAEWPSGPIDEGSASASGTLRAVGASLNDANWPLQCHSLQVKEVAKGFNAKDIMSGHLRSWLPRQCC